MDAQFILNSIRKKYPEAAIVPELSIDDLDMPSEEGIVESWVYKRRIDALMFESFLRTAIEIKVSKADMARETWWKRRKWRQCTHRFIYAVPHDLDVNVPHGCGLWKVHENGLITVERKAIVSKTPEHLPQDVIQRMAYRVSNTARTQDLQPQLGTSNA